MRFPENMPVYESLNEKEKIGVHVYLLMRKNKPPLSRKDLEERTLFSKKQILYILHGKMDLNPVVIKHLTVDGLGLESTFDITDSSCYYSQSWDVKLGTNVYILARKHSISNTDLGRMINRSSEQVGHIIFGKRPMRAEEIQIICEFFGITPDYLLPVR